VSCSFDDITSTRGYASSQISNAQISQLVDWLTCGCGSKLY